jgi:hypothetical protein
VSGLAAFVDGVSLPEPEARALWERFSLYMDAHKGDLGGFARAEGFASVRPETRNGRAVLVASRSAPQQPYVSAPAAGAGGGGTKAPGGGSGAPQRGADRGDGRGRPPGKRRRR